MAYPKSKEDAARPQTPPPPYEFIQPVFHANTQSPAIVVQPAAVQPIYLANRTYLNFTGAFVISCLVIWFCGILFGLIALVLALVGQSSASNGNESSARPLLFSSYVVSAIGVACGIIIFILFARSRSNAYT